MKAVLSYLDNYILIQDFSCNEYDSSYIGFNIKVKSGEWTGFETGCESLISDWNEWIENLKRLFSFEVSAVDFQEVGYGGTIHIEMDSLGHIIVSGKIYGSGMEHSLEFTFQADQTVLGAFIKQLEDLR